MYVVYGLEDPRDNTVFYVGMTSDVYARYIQHIKCEGNNAEKNERIHQLKSLGLLPTPITLEVVRTLTEGQQRELYWISHYAYLGMSLTNEIRPAMVRRIKTMTPSQVNKLLKAVAKPTISTDDLAALSSSPEAERVLEMLREKRGQNEIIESVWGLKSTDGRPYRAAVEEYRNILAALVGRLG